MQQNDLVDILPITATDIDLSGDRIQFSIENNEYFDLEWLGVDDISRRKTTARLKLKNEIQPPFVGTYEITTYVSGFSDVQM